MARIQEIDKNLAHAEVKDGLRFYDVRKAPFSLHGLYKPETPGLFRRCPEEVAAASDPGVLFLHTNTTGARVRFRTDSRTIAIRASEPTFCCMPHQAVTGSSGFDLYGDGEYYKTFVPPIDYQGGFMPHFSMEGGYETQNVFPEKKMREIMIHFPTYNDVTDLFVGLEEDAILEAATPYALEKPIVFYGSSITHGCSATKPGNTYPNLLSRWLNADILNLAFSGNCRAQDAMSEYISTLDMSAFVYDYDHNAPDAAFLKRTHEKLFLHLREKQPELPVIFASKPGPEYDPEGMLRRDIILETFQNAQARGDRNVYFVDGATMFDLLDRSACTVDGAHPTDLGFYCMAKAFEPVLREILFGESTK